MHPELVINCDDIRIHIKDGKLLTVTIGNTQPFDFQYIVKAYDCFLKAGTYDEECYYHEEWAKASKKFRILMRNFKRYNENGENPLLRSICWALDEKNTEEFLSCLDSDFFNS